MENVEFKEEIVNEVEILDPYGFIYITTNMINGKKYIGQSTFNKNKKWKVYLGSGIILSRAIKKYGKCNFGKEIVAIAYSKEELNSLEIEIIKSHGALESLDYYNLSSGGESGNAGTNHIFSEEHKQKISKSNMGRTRSDETKQKMSKYLEKIHMKNIKITDQKQILEIRSKYKTGEYSQKELAKEYCVSPNTISCVINFKKGYKN